MGITDETQVAVLIQELVPAEVAGVLFTCDPLSGRRDRWMVEACWGLGEAVVEGLVTPDHYTLTPGPRDAQRDRKRWRVSRRF